MTSGGTDPHRVLLDPDQQAEYDAEGYTVVPLLTPDEIDDLLARYAEVVPDADEEIIAFDFTRDDRTVMAKVALLLEPLFARKIPGLFVDHEAVFWTFVIKPPGPHSELSLHDDRTYLEAEHGGACTVWVPLVDTGPHLDNGYLCVVPGSHTVMPAPSGTNIPSWYEPYLDYLKDHSRPLTVPAGSALIYDSKTLHWSPPNRSDVLRPAIAAAVVPAGRPLVHVVGEGMHHRRVYAVDKAFFVDHHPTAVEGGMPDGYPLLREYWEERVSATPEEVAAAIGADDLPIPVGDVTAPVPRNYEPAGAGAGETAGAIAGGPETDTSPYGGEPAPPAGHRRWWRRVRSA